MSPNRVGHIVSVLALVALFLFPLMSARANATVVLNSATWSGNGLTYHLIAAGDSGNPEGISWSDAEAYAVSSLGGHLATVDSLALDQWIWDTFGKDANRNLWIGLTDEVAEGQFKWIATGAALSYAHWYPYEPNNSGNEDYVFILASGFSGGSGPGGGTWNDGQNGWTGFFGAPTYAIAETAGTAVAVPEPSTLLGLVFGVGTAGGYLTRRFCRNR